MNIRNKITRTVGSNKLRLNKNAPHIMFGVGVVGSVVSTVLACRATLKLEAALADLQADVLGAKHPVASDERPEGTVQKDIARAYMKGSFSIARLYAPAAVVGVASVSLLTSSHVQLTRRNATLTLAYSALHETYMGYRERVRTELGEERERELHFGTIEEKYIDEKGKEQTVKTLNPNAMSVYARCFDESNPNWTRDPELNRLFIQCQQNYANHRLHAIGHVFLNEIYDMLGMERSSTGQIVGWKVGNDTGDNYIDFGLFSSPLFMNNIERSVWLDFNVDGPILDLI